MITVRYSAAEKRRIAAEQAAAKAAEDARLAALPLDEFLAEAALIDLAAQIDPEGFVEFQSARHAALVAAHAEEHPCVCDHCREAGSCFGCDSGVCP